MPKARFRIGFLGLTLRKRASVLSHRRHGNSAAHRVRLYLATTSGSTWSPSPGPVGGTSLPSWKWGGVAHSGSSQPTYSTAETRGDAQARWTPTSGRTWGETG